MWDCLAPSGVFHGLVPWNARIIDVHYLQRLDRSETVSKVYAAISRSLPTQAAFVSVRA
jgi:hypothetical protein